MPGEQQTEEEEEEGMQEEMVLLVKGEEDEGEEKYEVVKLKIPADNKEVGVPRVGAPHPGPGPASLGQRSCSNFAQDLRPRISALARLCLLHSCTHCRCAVTLPTELGIWKGVTDK